MAPRALQKADREVATRVTWHDQHVLLCIQALEVPGNIPAGGKANGKMVKRNVTWEPIVKAINEQTPFVNNEIKASGFKRNSASFFKRGSYQKYRLPSRNYLAGIVYR